MLQEAIPNAEMPLKCPNCNSLLVNSEDELVCSRCGLIVDFQRYVVSQDQNHTVQEDFFYGSIIAEYGLGNNISRLQRNIFSSKGRREKELKWIIDRVCENFHLGSSIKLHSYKIGLVLLRKHHKGDKRLNLAAIATYSVITAARFHNLNIVPRCKKIQSYLQSIGFKIRVKDLFQVSFDAREIGITGAKCEHIKTINEIISMIFKNNTRLQRLELDDRIRFLNYLRTSSIRLFEDLKAKHYYFRSKNPMICLVSAIYAASKEIASMLNIKNPVTQRELAGYIGYAEYSVRETYEDLFGKNKILINQPSPSG